MNTKFYKAKLKQWDDEKGFGFLAATKGEKDIFIHISALKRMSRRPIVGDIIYYRIYTDANGKCRAINAKIEGVMANRRGIKKRKDKGASTFIPLLLLIFIGILSYGYFFQGNILKENISLKDGWKPVFVAKNQTNYSCNGKVYCSEMTSCAEAKFYQNNCSGTKMDGDGDGIPCERQWCSSW